MPLASTSSGLTISQEISFLEHRLHQAVPAFHRALLSCAFSKAHHSRLCPGTRRPSPVNTVRSPPFGRERSAAAAAPPCPAQARALPVVLKPFPPSRPASLFWMRAPSGHVSAGKPFLKAFPPRTYQPRSCMIRSCLSRMRKTFQINIDSRNVSPTFFLPETW